MATRVNLCPNPACKNNATGWSSNTTVARTDAITGMVRTTGMVLTGNGFIRTPTGVCVPGDIKTVSFYIKNGTDFELTGGKQVFIGYTLSTGGESYPSGYDFNTPTIGPVGNVVRGVSTTPAAPANANGIFLIVDALNGTSGSGFFVTGVLYEDSPGPVDPYFDGDSTYAVWNGTNGNSTSTYTDPAAVKPGAFIPFL